MAKKIYKATITMYVEADGRDSAKSIVQDWAGDTVIDEAHVAINLNQIHRAPDSRVLYTEE